MVSEINDDIIIVTGLSGAGRSTCLRLFEDHGFEAIDNLPLNLMTAAIEPFFSEPQQKKAKKVAIGLDPRTRNFNAQVLLDSIAEIQSKNFQIRVLFLDCDDETLIRRFTETRRKHPLASERPVRDGIRAERQLLAKIREHSDIFIDSSNLTLPQFQTLLKNKMGIQSSDKLTLAIISFGFRNGLPSETDMIFDVRFLKNPHYRSELRPLNGTATEIGKFIEGDPIFLLFFNNLTNFLEPLFPRYADEGKGYLTIGFGCTGGQHRSVFVAEKITRWLKTLHYQVALRHRDLKTATPLPKNNITGE